MADNAVGSRPSRSPAIRFRSLHRTVGNTSRSWARKSRSHKDLKKTGALRGIDKRTVKVVWEVIQSIKAGDPATGVTAADIKGPEWEVSTDPNPPSDWPHFLSKSVAPPKDFQKRIASVLPLERLQEVKPLCSFTAAGIPMDACAMRSSAFSIAYRNTRRTTAAPPEAAVR
jgi:hypothetical protein